MKAICLHAARAVITDCCSGKSRAAMRARRCFAWATWMGWCPWRGRSVAPRGGDYRGSLFDAEDVRKTVARLTAEGRVSRVVVLIETLDPSDIERLFRAGATEVIAARSICGNGRAGEGTVDYDRCLTIEPDAFVDREPGAPRATRGPRVDDCGKAEAEHGRCPRDPLAYDEVGEPVPYGEDLLAVDMGYVHGVSLVDELDEVEGLAGSDSVRVDATVKSPDSVPQTEQPAIPAWAQHMSAAGETGALPSVPASPAPASPADAAAPSHRAPVVCVVSGSGGCGKSTIVAAMRTRRRCWACVLPCSIWT